MKEPIFNASLTIEATPEEAEALNKSNSTVDEETRQTFRRALEMQEASLPKGRIARLKSKQVNKFTTPLWQIEDMFISYQRGKNNTEATIKYYQKVFRNLYRFVAYLVSESPADYAKMLNTSKEALTEHTLNDLEFGKIMPLVVLETDDFEAEYHDYILDYLECNEQTLNNIFRGWRAIAYFCMDKGWIDMRNIYIREVAPAIKEVYTDSEIEKLLVKPRPEDFIEYRNWVIINYFLATGNRISSVANLKISDLDFDEGIITVNVQKNRDPSRIAMAEKLKPILIEYIRHYRCDENGIPLNKAYVFCNSYGSKCGPVALGKSLGEYNKSRGVQKTSCHLWRHTFAKRWIQSGGDILSLQKILGHRSLKMVQRYSNLFAEDTKPMVEEHAPINTVRINRGKTKLAFRK